VRWIGGCGTALAAAKAAAAINWGSGCSCSRGNSSIEGCYIRCSVAGGRSETFNDGFEFDGRKKEGREGRGKGVVGKEGWLSV
jgi:hypothetical protein